MFLDCIFNKSLLNLYIQRFKNFWVKIWLIYPDTKPKYQPLNNLIEN